MTKRIAALLFIGMIAGTARESLGETLEFSVNRLKPNLEWVTSSQQIPLPIAIAIQTSIWFAQVETFRITEETLSKEEYDKSLDSHRFFISFLIHEGETLILASKQNSLTKLESGVSLKDLEATVDSLRSTYEIEHRRTFSEKIKAFISSFSDEQPEAKNI